MLENILEDGNFDIGDGGVNVKIIEVVRSEEKSEPRWLVRVASSVRGHGVSVNFPLWPIMIPWLLEALPRTLTRIKAVRAEAVNHPDWRTTEYGERPTLYVHREGGVDVPDERQERADPDHLKVARVLTRFLGRR